MTAPIKPTDPDDELLASLNADAQDDDILASLNGPPKSALKVNPEEAKHQASRELVRKYVQPIAPLAGRVLETTLSQVIETGQDIAHGVTHPRETLAAGKSAISELSQLPSMIMNNVQQRTVTQNVLKPFVWDGLIKPLLANPIDLTQNAVAKAFGIGPTLTPEEADKLQREAQSAWAGIGVGMAVGGATKAGKLSSATSAIRKAKTLEEAAGVVATLPLEMQVALRDPKLLTSIIDGAKASVAEGMSGGATMAITGEGTPEEKFKNAVTYGVLGSTIPMAIHATAAPFKSIASVITGKPTAVEFAATAAKQLDLQQQSKLLLRLAPEDRVIATDQLLKGVPIEKVIAERTDQPTILRNVGPNVSEALSGLDYIKHVDSEGNTTVLVNRLRNSEPTEPVIAPESTTKSADVAFENKIAESVPEAAQAIVDLRSKGLHNQADMLIDLMNQRDAAWRAANTDPLTGIGNQRALARAIDTANADPSVAVISFDANNFGKVNKQLGQAAGDKAIQEIAQVMSGALESSDSRFRVFRNGGDEFVVLAPTEKAEMIRNTIENNYGTKKYGNVDVSISGTVGETLSKAEEALQARKAARKGISLEAQTKAAQASNGVFTSEQIKFFEKHGYVPGEKVNYSGKDMFVEGGTSKSLVLRDAETGVSVSISPEKITRLPELSILSDKVREEPLKIQRADGSEALIGDLPDTKASVNTLSTSIDFSKSVDDIVSGLDEPSRAAYETNKMDLARDLNVRALDATTIANAKGARIELNGNDVVVKLSDGSSQKFPTLESAEKFITDLNQPTGPSFTGESAGGNTLPPDAGTIPNHPLSDDPVKIYSSWLDPLSTMRPDIAKSRARSFLDYDTVHGTETYRKVFDPLQNAYRHFNAAMQPYRALIAPIAETLRSLSPERRKIIGEALETHSLDDLLSADPSRRLRRSRSVTDAEKGFASQLSTLVKQADGGVVENNAVRSIRKAFEYRRALREFNEAGLKPEELQQKLAELQQLYQNEIPIAELFNRIERLPQDKAGILDVVSLVEAELTNKMSQADYMKAHNFTPKERTATQHIRNFYDKLATVFGIEDSSVLNHYMSHVEKYDMGNFSASSLKNQAWLNKKEYQFLSDLPRTGEVVDFEKDPIRNMMGYLYTGMRQKHVAEVEFAARQELSTAVSSVKNPAAAEALMQTGKYYMDEIAQRTLPADARLNAAAQNYVNKLLKRFGKEIKDVDIKRNVTNGINRFFEAAAQGFRPAAGARDLMFGIQFYVMHHDPDRLVNALKLLGEAKRRGTELQTKGEISGLEPVIIEDQPLNIGSNAFKAASDASFKASLQPQSYKLLQSIVMLETRDNAMSAFKKHGAKTSEVAKTVDLDIYPEPVQKAFVDLANAGKQEEAVNFLGRAAVQQLVGNYGLANHPAGFGTAYGRMFGQFGTWPIWFADQMQNLVGGGSPTRKIKVAAKLGALMWAGKELTEETGVNLPYYLFAPGAWASYRGGPTVQLGLEAANLFSQNPRDKRDAEWFWNNLLPTQERYRSIVVPFSYAAQNAKDAYEELAKGNNFDAFLRFMSLKKLKK